MKKKNLKKRHLVIFLILLLIFIILFSYKTKNNFTAKTVRVPAVAGTWYPGEKEELSNLVTNYLSKANYIEVNGEIKALIVPHAGYIYSGQIAAFGFKQLKKYKTVIVLGISHHYPLEKASILNVDYYKTPLGNIKISDKAKKLLKEDIITTVPKAHAKEHSIEIELPFLQKVLGDFELIPVLVGDTDLDKLAEILIENIDDETLMVASSDLSHYHSYDEAVSLDNQCINAISKMDINKTAECEACGLKPILTLMKIAEKLGWKNIPIIYANSGDVTGDKTRVVGYASILFYEEKSKLTKKEKDFLLSLARKTLEEYYKTGKKIKINGTLTENLLNVQGCFVTLIKHGALRGCIGHITPNEELYKCVIDNAINAAINDMRFDPVEEEELEDIVIDISVLSVPEKLSFSSGEDLKNQLKPLIDGVVLKQGFYQSTYLPQVWEQLPDKEQFLSSLCNKGGLKSDCWQDTKTEVFTYQADVFEEE